MQFFKRLVPIILSLFVLFACVGCEEGVMSVEAKKIEEIRGTYSLSKYYCTISGDKMDLKDNFEYFYLVVSKDSVVRVVYKGADDSEYTANEYGFTCKYKSGSDGEVQEIRVRFNLPYAYDGEGVEINYFNISSGNSLVCQKISYVNEAEQTYSINMVVFAIKKVSSVDDYSYIEQSVGYKIDNVEDFYLPSTQAARTQD